MLMVSELFNVYRFPLGRMAFSLGDVAERAARLPQPVAPVADFARFAANTAREALQRESLYRAARTSGGKYPREALDLDKRVDRCAGGVHGYLQSQATTFPGTPRGKSAQYLVDLLFAEGLAAIIQLPFAAQHERVTVLIRTAALPENAEHVARLGDLPAMLDELAALNEQYGEALRRLASAPTGEEMRAERARCQQQLCATMGMIIAHFEAHAPDRMADRDHLLEPILTQNEAIRLARRRRNPPTDTDPDTGLVVEDPADDGALDADPDVDPDTGDEIAALEDATSAA